MAVHFSEDEYRALVGDVPAQSQRSKYRNRKVYLDGIRFDSERERDRYAELKLMARAGEIEDLKLQPVFELVPAIKEAGEVIQHPVRYRADFSYIKDGGLVVEDAKGVKTAVYEVKKKLMRYFLGIVIEEI